LLDGANVVAVLQQVGGEGVPEGVGAGHLGDAGGAAGGADGALDGRLVEVVPADLAGGRIGVVAGGGEDPLPDPLAAGGGVLSSNGVGEVDVAGVGGYVAFVLPADRVQVAPQVFDEGLGHHGHAILAALAGAH